MSVEEENLQAQRDELDVLGSIFGDDLVTETADSTTEQPTIVSLTFRLAPGTCTIRCHLPIDYPSTTPPFYELLPQGWELGDALRERLAEQLQGMFFPGEVVLFSWMSYLQEELVSLYGPYEEEPDIPPEDAEAELPSSPPPATKYSTAATPSQTKPADEEDDLDYRTFALPPGCPPIYTHPEPVIDRKSVFLAHTAPVKSVEEVKQVIQALYTNRKIGE
ncbi:hypothetical protein HK097_007314 [Rhizophlyctis rosea]|uniref:RWD domain-containing protein n=1 Tax=Rhizophlyctis rosea TaxID=64517 RepID=A0AAD5SJY4_9FUNG|nr:hypothetical protein HK097_007314 [Rhizophlyctis rosea]